jgi:hypothetical protein
VGTTYRSTIWLDIVGGKGRISSLSDYQTRVNTGVGWKWRPRLVAERKDGRGDKFNDFANIITIISRFSQTNDGIPHCME